MIVADECHRGYTIDGELSDSELTIRDDTDYGLIATPVQLGSTCKTGGLVG